jgi:tetratricopeptide (TPR) repeat protein
MKCPKCQIPNPSDAIFCAKCATKLDSSAKFSVTRTLETSPEGLGKGKLFAGRFELIEKLGAGGMGIVYRAYDKEVGEEMAIKILHSEIALDEGTVDRFRNEIKLARKISHRNVCRMHELHQDGKQLFITMEYVSGQDLKDLIKETGTLATGQVLSIAKQVAEGMAEAHDLGVIHRDFKPQNIMVDKEGNAKIMDFGIARSLRTEGMTAEGVIIGTPDYMAPEQVEGLETDQRTDIYALGAILFEMATGRVPFEGDTPLSVAYKHKNELPLPPRKLNAQIPEPFNQLILRCLEKEKENRYQTADELLADLIRIEDSLPISERVILKARPTIRISRKKATGLRRFLVPALVFLCIVIAAAVLYRTVIKKSAPPTASKIANSVAIISFTNLTGEKDLDIWSRGVPELLITNLENTGYFQVTTWERMRDILKQMGKKDVETIDSDLGFELCRMGGIESLVTGTLTKAGDMFALDVRVLDAETKKLRKSAGSRGEGVASIIKTQVDELSRAIAEGLSTDGEKIEQSQFQVAEMTTTSPEAYRLFIIGKERTSKVDFEKAAEYLERAVQIDPEFAVAYMVLSGAYFMSGKHNQGRKALTKARELSGHASDRDRLFIEQSYAFWVEKDLEKSKSILEEIIKKYPDDKESHSHLGFCLAIQGRFADAVREYQEVLRLDPNSGGAFNMLGLAYANLGEFEKAIEALKKYIALTPGEPNPWDSLSVAYIKMGKVDEAIASYTEALKIKPDFEISNMTISYLYAFKEDYPAALDSIDRYLSLDLSPERRADASLWKGFCLYWLGRFSESLNAFQQAEEASRTADWLFKPALFLLRFMLYFDREEFEAARQSVQRYVDYRVEQNPKRGVHFITFGDCLRGLCNVKEGRLDLARTELGEMKSALEDLSGRDKENLMENVSILQAEIDLTEGSIKEAMVSLEKIVPSSGFQPNQPFNFYILMNRNWSLYKEQWARIYTKKGDINKAIAEYERLIAPDPKKTNALIHPRCYYSLGRLYEEKSWEDKAIDQYEKFLDLWKDADPGIAEVVDARERLAGLRN